MTVARFGGAALLALACFLAAGTWGPGPAQAQGPVCMARQDLLDSLADTHRVRPVNMGVTSTGALLEVLASPTGSWTILITVPGGPTCMVSSGQGWRSFRRPTRKDPEA